MASYQTDTRTTFIDVPPFGQLSTSLGTFPKNNEPRGFCVELGPASHKTDLITADMVTHDLPHGRQYVLTIINHSPKKQRVNVRVF